MIKRLGTLAAALALAALPAFAVLSPVDALAANCSGGSGSCAQANFGLSATVNTIATISFDVTTFTWSSTAFNQFNNGSVEASNFGTINASLRTTAGSGTGSIYFTAPSTIPGTASGNSINVNSLLTFTCNGTYQPNTTSGPGTATSVSGSTSSATSVSSSSNNACASFTSGASVAATNLALHLFLNGDTLPADTYSTSNTGGTQFTIFVSST
jgi:hypothetical protein